MNYELTKFDRQELECHFGGAKSFYKKAYIESDGKEARLYSYGTLIAKTDSYKLTLIDLDEEDYTRTTVRHLKDFTFQLAYGAVGHFGIDYVRWLLSNKSHSVDYTTVQEFTRGQKWNTDFYELYANKK